MKLKFRQISFSERDFGVFATSRPPTVLSQSMRAHNTATTDPESTLAMVLGLLVLKLKNWLGTTCVSLCAKASFFCLWLTYYKVRTGLIGSWT